MTPLPMTLLKEMLASLVVGDGVVAAAMPRRHTRRWAQVGPGAWRDSMRWLARHPSAKLALSAAQVGLGVWYARRLPEDLDGQP